MGTKADMTVKGVAENADAQVSIVGGQVIEATAAPGKIRSTIIVPRITPVSARNETSFLPRRSAAIMAHTVQPD